VSLYRNSETAIARVLLDILMALDCGDVAALALLDLAAAFDTVDHCILYCAVSVYHMASAERR